MDMSGEYRIAAPRERVWEALNDPEVLKACIPGCESLEKLSDTEMKATVVARIGPVKARFNGAVTLSDLVPPESYRIAGEGSGGVAGFANGGADVHLAEDGADTLLTYKVHAKVGGKLAQVGSRLVDSAARKMADDFFGAFTEKLAPPEALDEENIFERAEHIVEDAAHAVEETAHAAEERLETAAGRGAFGGPVVWAWIALALMAVGLLLMTR
ncbi:MAG: carbon monoxide dehydrogenase subunit G [Hyphomicrobiales bacterium]